MKVVGLTGGIASGKTTIVMMLKKYKIAVHDSDLVVSGIYSKPKTGFLRHLKKTSLGKSIKGKRIDKKIIREEIFNNTKKRKLLEGYIHAEVKKARNAFLKKHKQKKTDIVFLDIPLLFEKKLEKICHFTILFYASLAIRKKRAIRRRGMQKKILEKIINSQLSDKIKKKKADFVVDTSGIKSRCFNEFLRIVESIKKK
jgi:dephospho-CoA kinase